MTKRFFLISLIVLTSCVVYETNEKLVALSEKYHNVDARVPNTCHDLRYSLHDSDRGMSYKSNTYDYDKYNYNDVNKLFILPSIFEFFCV